MIRSLSRQLANLYFLIEQIRNWPSALLFRAGWTSGCRAMFRDSDHLDAGASGTDWVVLLMVTQLKHHLTAFKIEHLGGDNLQLTITNGLKFLVNNETIKDALIAIEEQFVHDFYRVRNISLDGQTVIDVGANIGDSSLLFASKGASVYAFEPVPSTFQSLLENITVNGCTNKIFPFNVGLSDRNEERVVETNPVNSLSFSLEQNKKFDGKKFETITLVETIGFLKQNNIRACDILKIDCEGCEYVLLRDPSLVHYLNPKRVMIEYHGGREKLLVDLLENLFEDVERVPSETHPDCGILYANRRKLTRDS